MATNNEFYEGENEEELDIEKENEKIYQQLLKDLSVQNKEEKPIEQKKEISSNIEFDLFTFNDNNKKNDESKNTNQNNSKNTNFDLLFSLNNNQNEENGGKNQKENGQTQQKSSNDGILDFNISNTSNQSNTNNKSQDIFGFFQ